MSRPGTAVVLMALALSGCGGPSTAPPSAAARSSQRGSAVATTTLAPLHMVVFGDSLADTANHCQGCVGFVDQFAKRVERQVGRPVEANLTLTLTVPDAVAAVQSHDPSLQSADIVLVQVGYNNALPDPDTGIGCGGSLAEGIPAWIFSTRPSCLRQGIATYGHLYDQILSGMKQLRGDKPTVYVLTNTVNGNIQPGTEGLISEFSTLPKPQAAAGLKWTLDAYDRWNAMLKERSSVNGYQYVDLWHVANGPDGKRPLGDLSVDATHPSQKGNDAFAAELAKVDLSALRP